MEFIETFWDRILTGIPVLLFKFNYNHIPSCIDYPANSNEKHQNSHETCPIKIANEENFVKAIHR